SGPRCGWRKVRRRARRSRLALSAHRMANKPPLSNYAYGNRRPGHIRAAGDLPKTRRLPRFSNLRGSGILAKDEARGPRRLPARAGSNLGPAMAARRTHCDRAPDVDHPGALSDGSVAPASKANV